MMKSLVARVRRRFTEVRPARPRRRVDRRRAYGYALIGVAVLTALAWCTDSDRLAVGFLVALVLGVLWVAWTAHQALIAPAFALGWWFVTAPAMGLIAATGIEGASAFLAVSPATATIGILGVVVGLAAVVSREPRPTLTIMAAWATNSATVYISSMVVPTIAWTVGYVLTIALVVWRTGFRLRSRNQGRPAGVPSELYDVLSTVPGAYVGALPPSKGGPVPLLVAPSGTFTVTTVEAAGTVRHTLRGTRLLLNGRTLPKVRTATRSARRAAKLLHTPVQPVLAVLDATFEDGLSRVSIEDDPLEVLVIRADLLGPRLAYDSPVLSGGQIGRLVRRVRKLAPEENSPIEDEGSGDTGPAGDDPADGEATADTPSDTPSEEPASDEPASDEAASEELASDAPASDEAASDEPAGGGKPAGAKAGRSGRRRRKAAGPRAGTVTEA